MSKSFAHMTKRLPHITKSPADARKPDARQSQIAGGARALARFNDQMPVNGEAA
jgi:hypothetical protein